MRVKLDLEGLPNRWSGEVLLEFAAARRSMKLDNVTTETLGGVMQELGEWTQKLLDGDAAGALPDWVRFPGEERSAAEAFVKIALRLDDDDD